MSWFRRRTFDYTDQNVRFARRRRAYWPAKSDLRSPIHGLIAALPGPAVRGGRIGGGFSKGLTRPDPGPAHRGGRSGWSRCCCGRAAAARFGCRCRPREGAWRRSGAAWGRARGRMRALAARRRSAGAWVVAAVCADRARVRVAREGRRRNTHCHRHSRGAFGYFLSRAPGSFTARGRGEVPLVKRAHARQVRRGRGAECSAAS